MLFVDYVFLAFCMVSLYFLVLFMLLFLESKPLFDPEIEVTHQLPTVTLIVPAYNEEETVGGTVSCLKKLDYPKDLLEIIVVDDGSTDRTAKRASSPEVLVVTKVNGGKSEAVNLGISMAKSEIVGVVDADSFPEPDSLLRAVSRFRDPRVAAVTSTVLVREKRTLMQRLQAIEYYLSAWQKKLEKIECVSVTPGPLSLYRKSVLEVIGGFDKTVMTEDIEIAWRILKAGYLIRMAADARVYTNAPATLKVWWRQRIRWTLGSLQTAKKYLRHAFKKQNGMFGMFVVPQFITYTLISLFSFGLFAYVFYGRLFSLLSYVYYCDQVGMLPFSFSVDFMLGGSTALMVLSFSALMSCFRSMRRESEGFRDILDILIYQTVYFMLFPPILIQSIWRLIAYKKHRW